jgi:hypothetical protein
MAKWVSRIKDCLNIECLTREIVKEMVGRIEVSQTYDVDGKKNLDMAIFYKFGLGGTETAAEAKGYVSSRARACLRWNCVCRARTIARGPTADS